MLVRNILQTTSYNELKEISDKYDINPEELEGLMVNVFVKDLSKKVWKGGKTRFIKAFVEEVIALIEKEEIDWDDLGFMLYLSAKFTNYEDNILRKDDGSYITQKELIESIHAKKRKKTSPSSIRRKLVDLEKKKLIFAKPHPKNKNYKIYYLSPHLFYKGKLIDDKMKKSLEELTKGIKDELKLKTQNKSNADELFELDNRTNEELVAELLEGLSNLDLPNEINV